MLRVVERPGTPTAVIRETTTWQEYPALWPRLLDEIWQTIRAHDLPAGRNVMRYLDDVPNVEVGVELSGFEAIGRVVPSIFPAGPAATAKGAGDGGGDPGRPRGRRAVRAGAWPGAVRERFEVYDHQRDDATTLQMGGLLALGPAVNPPVEGLTLRQEC